MIFGKRAEQGLKYARARAKIDEFSADQSKIPRFPFDSDDLCFESILTISDAINELLAESHITVGTRRDLSYTASFLDAAANEKRHLQSRDLFLTLACASYFFLGNYGSSKSTLARICKTDAFGENARRYLLLTDYLLNGKKGDSFPFPLLASYLEGSFDDYVIALEETARKTAKGDAEEDFFADIINACALVSVRDAAATLLPLYSGIERTSWIPILQSIGFGKLLWQAQQRIGEGGAFAGSDLFIQLPTGTGKTKSIELLVRSRVLANRCHRAIVVAPLRALCSEIAKELKDGLGDVACVQHATDAFEVDTWLGVNSSIPEVLVFTPEKLSFVLHHSDLKAENVDLFIFDESHLIDNVSRGPSYELLLAEIMALRGNAQLVLISAVTSNPDKLSEWAFSDSSKYTKNDGIESTEKTVGFFSQEAGRIDFFQYGSSTDLSYFLPYRVPIRSFSLPSNKEGATFFPDLSASAKRRKSGDLALFYSIQLAHGGSSAIYIPKSNNVWAFHERIAELITFGLDFSQIVSTSNPEELGRFARLFVLHYGENCIFSKSASSGILPHFRTLQGAIKQATEYAMRKNAVRCVSCTSTLAQGVNLPIRYLLITDRFNGFEYATVRDFQNLIGRTARAGKYSEGSIIVCDAELESQNTRRDYWKLFKVSAVEDCKSAILSLLEDVTVHDGNKVKRLRGSTVVNFILEHFDDRELEAKLVSGLASSFECKPERISKEISVKITSLNAIENYVASMIATTGDDVPDTRAICAGTYAFFCADDDKQELLIKIFEAIYEHFEEQGGESRAEVVAKTQAGIRKADALRAWVKTKECTSFLESGCSNLMLIANAFYDITRPDFPKWLTVEGLAAISRLWIEGANIETILEQIESNCIPSPRSHPGLDSVGRITSEMVSYDLSHFVSQVSDTVSVILETSQYEEDLVYLQKQLKYGVRRKAESLLCESFLNDRLIAKQIYETMGVPPADNITALKMHALAKRAQIESLLKPYPSYYLNQFRSWLS